MLRLRHASLLVSLLLGACGSSATNSAPNTAGSSGAGVSGSNGAAGAGGGGSSAVGGGGKSTEGGAATTGGTPTSAGGQPSSAGGPMSGGAGAGGSGGGGGGATTSSGPFPANVTKPRIMIVGDSISAGPGCYKKYLLQELSQHGYSHFEFVGEYTDDCGGGVMHSAVSCSTAEQYTQATFTLPNCSQGKTFLGLSGLMPKHHPDLLMLQLGVNDVWGGRPTADILESYRKLVEQARAQNPRVVLAVAQIQKIRPDCGTDDSVQKRAEALVMAVPAWAQQLSTAQSPIFVADLWSNSDWNKAETNDCVHPNDVGAKRMGQNWYKALAPILKPD